MGRDSGVGEEYGMKCAGEDIDKKQKKWKKGLSVVLIAGMGVCILGIILYFIKADRAENTYEELRKYADVTEEAEDSDTGEETAETEERRHLTEIYEGIPEVEFEALWETNTDICAWITVPGTQVDYPVLRNESAENSYDDYYLQHTVERASGLPGAIYMQPCNQGDFTDANTVLYGHNMKNGTMFGSLHEFENDIFFTEHEYAYVVTPEKNLVYQIFAVVVYSDTHILGTYDFGTEHGYEAFLDSLYTNRSMADLFREGATVTTEDRILTLSTCMKNQDDKRLLVVGVLVDEEERE